MTIGSVQVWAWAAWLLAVFACVGLWAVLWQCDRFGRYLWERIHDRGDEVCARCLCSVWPDEIAAWSEGTQAIWREKRWCLPCQNESGLPWLPELPPERTWEQMTSHQLPLTAAACSYCGFGVALADDGTQCKSGAACPFAGQLVRYVSLPPEAGAADHFLRPPGYLDAERERRAPWWEAEHRAAYQSLGLDYPSGLLARVRGEL